MRTLSLNQKLASMIVILWLGLLVIAGVGAWQTRASMITDRRDQLASLVAQAASVADHYYKLSQQNALPAFTISTNRCLPFGSAKPDTSLPLSSVLIGCITITGFESLIEM